MNYEQVKHYISKSNGILLKKELSTVGITKYSINQLIKEGLIERYERGVYIRCDTLEDTFYILQQNNPSVVFSYNSAMYLHHASEQTPEWIDVTVFRGYKINTSSKHIRVHYVKREILNIGSSKQVTMNGFEVNAYDLERITCDLIKNRNIGIDTEQKNKFLRRMFLEKKIDTVKLMEYAKKLKCENKVRIIMEVFL